jgi:iron-sulfur cluster repair protein YtfE (RIC family)
MGSLSPVFKDDSGKIHSYHDHIFENLDALDVAMERLSEARDPATDIADLRRIEAIGREFSAELNEHWLHEEKTLLATVAAISRELAYFADEMKRQHRELGQKLDSFLAAIVEVQSQPNRAESFPHLLEAGRDFSRSLRAHISLEEQQLSGFL